VQDLFATHFEIGGENLDATFDEVATEILSGAWRGEGDPPQLSEDLYESRQEGRFHLRWSLLSLADRHERALERELDRTELLDHVLVRRRKPISRTGRGSRLGKSSPELAPVLQSDAFVLTDRPGCAASPRSWLCSSRTCRSWSAQPAR
jgi:hypothetical protein